MNPILSQMMGGMLSGNPIMNLFKTIRMAQNPNSAMQSAAQSNSQLGQVLNYINQNGGNAKQLYYNMPTKRNRS